LLKTVTKEAGAWLVNYRLFPWTKAAPIVAILMLAASALLLGRQRAGLALLASGLGIAAIIATAGLSLFPFMLPSSLDPRASLTVWDTSSSLLTLRIMLAATVIFLPMIMLYTAWVYNVLRGPINEAFVKDDRHSTVY
jgi:cytochrome d ubiquinol oxidase subunit II